MKLASEQRGAALKAGFERYLPFPFLFSFFFVFTFDEWTDLGNPGAVQNACHIVSTLFYFYLQGKRERRDKNSLIKTGRRADCLIAYPWKVGTMSYRQAQRRYSGQEIETCFRNPANEVDRLAFAWAMLSKLVGSRCSLWKRFGA